MKQARLHVSANVYAYRSAHSEVDVMADQVPSLRFLLQPLPHRHLLDTRNHAQLGVAITCILFSFAGMAVAGETTSREIFDGDLYHRYNYTEQDWQLVT